MSVGDNPKQTTVAIKRILTETKADKVARIKEMVGYGKIGSGSTKGMGKTTAKDWTGKTSDLAKQSPIEIPSNATVKTQNKAGGYDQITYQWSDGTYTYKARWHTPTPNAPAGSNNSWVVEQVKPGTPTGQLRVEKIYTPGVNGDWTPMWQWKDAVDAYNIGTMNSLQSEIMKAGHIPAP